MPGVIATYIHKLVYVPKKKAPRAGARRAEGGWGTQVCRDHAVELYEKRSTQSVR
jgi:hypothetical protein